MDEIVVFQVLLLLSLCQYLIVNFSLRFTVNMKQRFFLAGKIFKLKTLKKINCSEKFLFF